MEITCCFNCPSREVGCHSYCETYLGEKEKHEKDRKKVQYQKWLEYQETLQVRDSHKRIRTTRIKNN